MFIEYNSINLNKKLIMNVLLRFVVVLLIPVIYFLFNLHYINYSDFSEDAYILFRYVDMFNKGYGITYFPGAPPIEGATDFLWLISIIILNKLGFSIGVSSILLNSVGLFIINSIFYKILIKSSNQYKWYLLPIFFLWFLFLPLTAALQGFSVLLYCGLIVIILKCIMQNNTYHLVPIVGVVLGLFRPDGVILGIGLSIVVFYFTYNEDRSKLKTLIFTSLMSVSIGLIYFFWRMSYFNELLPLPLYVKSSGSMLQNLVENFKQFSYYKQIFIYVLVYALLLFGTKNKDFIKRFAIISIPFVTLFFSLMLSKQSQNIGFRFYAPILMFTIFSALYISVNNYNSKLVSLFIVVVLGFLSLKLINQMIYNYKYSNSKTSDFVLEMSKNYLEGNEHIVLTEAGRIAYYQTKNNEITDLVGLNTPYTAKNIIDQKYMESLNIDILMFWCENNFHDEYKPQLGYKRIMDKNKFFSKFDYGNIEELENKTVNSKITNSIIQSLVYLNHNWDDFHIYIINLDQNKKFEYIYAFKVNKNKKKDIEFIFNKVKYSPRNNYLNLEKMRLK